MFKLFWRQNYSRDENQENINKIMQLFVAFNQLFLVSLPNFEKDEFLFKIIYKYFENSTK